MEVENLGCSGGYHAPKKRSYRNVPTIRPQLITLVRLA
jgi:hypothetical protein